MSASYYSYRVFLTEPAQTELFNENKEERFRKLFTKVSEEHKIEFVDWGTEHIVCHYKKLNENIYIWQLGKKQEFSKPVVLIEKIENVNDVKYPFIYLIFHIKKQIVFIQMNSSVFQDLDSVKSKMERFFSQELSEGKIIVHLTEISDQREFWAKVKEMDSVQEVEFDYNPPNYFRGKNAVDNLVKDVHQETDFQKFKIILQNKVSGLIFDFETFGEHIGRLSSGAGKYIIKCVKDGFPYTLKSFLIPFKKNIVDIDKCEEGKLEDDFDEANNLNNGNS